MTPGDPGHGTLTGYKNGCREACCRRAKRLHETQRRRDRDRGITYLIDATGTRRRIRALMRIGWPARELAAQCGWACPQAVQLLANNRDMVNRKSAAKIAALYDALCMTPGPSVTTRRRAERAGWPPPLAWDDIDDPDEQPQVGQDTPRGHNDYDHARVERVINDGERLHLTRAERVEVVRRLRDVRGWSEERIEAHTGITQACNRTRYPRPDEEDAA